MRIACDNCAAKYAIADDKVRGRVFKIRCKRCDGAIVVRGDALLSAAPHAPAAVWHVLEDGEDHGPRALEELGSLDPDVYVWREGMDEWRRAADVEELAAAVERSARSAPHAPSAPHALSAPPAPSEDLTGARNEASVLFSISNLRALSEEPAPAASPAAPAATEGSGLIDIRALAGALAQPAAAPEPDRVDDLLTIGSPVGNPLGAPAIVPAREPSRRLPLLLGLGVAGFAVVVIGVVTAVALTREAPVTQSEDITAHDRVPEIGRVSESTPEETAPVATRSTHDPAETDLAETSPVAELGATTGDEPASTDATPDAPDAPRADGEQPRVRPRVAQHRPRPVETRPAQTRPEPRADDGERTIGELIDDSLGSREEPARPRTREERPGRVTPSRTEIATAMRRIEPQVRACGGGAHGSAFVDLTLRGRDGHVSSARVDSGLPPAARSCIARQVRSVTVPAFRRDHFQVRFPFRI